MNVGMMKPYPCDYCGGTCMNTDQGRKCVDCKCPALPESQSGPYNKKKTGPKTQGATRKDNT